MPAGYGCYFELVDPQNDTVFMNKNILIRIFKLIKHYHPYSGIFIDEILSQVDSNLIPWSILYTGQIFPSFFIFSFILLKLFSSGSIFLYTLYIKDLIH